MTGSEFKELCAVGNVCFDERIILESGVFDAMGATIEAKGGILIWNEDVTLLNATIKGKIRIEARGALIENCNVIYDGTAISSQGADLIIKGCRVEGGENAISLGAGSYNCLVAQNTVLGGISVKNGYNCTVLLNSADSVKCEECKNVYVVENTVSGTLSLSANKYLLADGNSVKETFAADNSCFNGDNVTSVDSRLPSGADLDLLPHVNRDLFVGMERRKYVNATDSDGDMSISRYVMDRAREDKTVIVPPGAYISPEPIAVEGLSGVTVYAYGALQEMCEYGLSVNLTSCSDTAVKGLCTAYAKQPCGQVTVLEELDPATLLVCPYAGSDGFGRSDPSRFSVGFTDVFRRGEIYPWGTMGGSYSLEENGDGTMIMHLLDNNSKIGEMHKGDRIVCRLGGGDKISIRISSSQNILFKDTFLFCHSACLAVVASGDTENVHFYRWYNGAEAAPIIDRETYDKYRALEEKHGIDGEVYIDSLSRYRGGQPLICSSDATHIVGCKRGVDATSCLLESMCDDGSNQRSASSRLAAVSDNGDGTTTLIYKGSVARVYCLNHFNPNSPRPSSCTPFRRGDRILAYNSAGVTFCDTVCLSDTEEMEKYEFTISPEGLEPRHYTDVLRKVTVSTAALNFDAIEGYDLSDNHYDMTNKVLVDNLSRNSAGFRFDNVMVRNTRSRGILVKTVGASINNCTFQNLGHTGVLLSVEFVWGESTVSQDVSVTRCLFDNVGFINRFFSYKPLSPIAINGLSSTVDEHSLLYKNIHIEGNRFINNQHNFAITVNSAQNVRILNNIFEEGVGESEENPKRAIDVETAMNVEISGNSFSKYTHNASEAISAHNFKNIFGEDICLAGDID